MRSTTADTFASYEMCGSGRHGAGGQPANPRPSYDISGLNGGAGGGGSGISKGFRQHQQQHQQQRDALDNGDDDYDEVESEESDREGGVHRKIAASSSFTAGHGAWYGEQEEKLVQKVRRMARPNGRMDSPP